MCTGDNLDTAIAISKNANIVTNDMMNKNEESKQLTCMEGPDFRAYIYEFTKDDPKYDEKQANCGFGEMTNFN